MFCIEIFAGTGRLTASLRALGLRDSFGIDSTLPSHLRSPIIKYDLLRPDHVALVKDLIASDQCVFVHFAPPCGTSSRARLIQRRGRFNPPIARTDQFPNGIPSLTGDLLARVQAANNLSLVTCNLVEWCISHQTYFAVENPGRSFMWQTTPFKQLQKRYVLLEVFFHHCRYGSSRRKLTRFLHNIPAFSALEAFRQNDHTHEAWGQNPQGHWNAAEETAYPWELCKCIAAKILSQLKQDGFDVAPPVFALQEASLQTMRATTDIQPRRGLPPMVSEFQSVHQQSCQEPLPPNARKLSTPLRGSDASADTGKITVGVHRTPEFFVKEAISIGHPTRMHSLFPDEINEVVSRCLHEGGHQLALSRTEEIKRWMHLARSKEADEAALKSSISARRRNVLKDKKLCLFKTLILESEHDDVQLIDQLVNGFDRLFARIKCFQQAYEASSYVV